MKGTSLFLYIIERAIGALATIAIAERSDAMYAHLSNRDRLTLTYIIYNIHTIQLLEKRQ